ncbi:MAG: DNA-directed RNA polymerase subunit alpha C-terminal domain-containing protein [Oscillospiraceae bacterium]
MKCDDKSSPGIEALDLNVRAFNALKRAGINTIADIENHAETLDNLIPFKYYKEVMDKLSEYKGIPTIGSWVEKDMLGDELTFEEITNMVGELIVMDMSTESHEWYKVERVEAIIDGDDGKRHLRIYDGSKQRGMVNEIFFDKDGHRPERAWRLKTNTPVSLPAPAQTETAVAAFDYSELDADTAHSLKECETVIRTETAGYFTILGTKFKEAQELLANHSSGTFEQWYTAMGFKRQTVYNLIQRFEFSSSPTIGGREEAFEALPLTLSYEISKPAAPAELVDKVLDGDITTNAEYRRIKAELEEAEKRAESAESSAKKLHTELNLTKDNLLNVEMNYKEQEKLRKETDDENIALQLKIKELESRPVEATFTDNSEELEEKDKEISELKEEIERLSDRNVKVFTIRLTIDEYEKLFGIVKESNDFVLMEAVKKAQIIRL